MRLILLPQGSRELRSVYERAIEKANELYFFTAYLTGWDFKRKLSKKCAKIEVYFGKDFGISRKAAIANLLLWLPKNQKCNLFVIDKIGGFHPKLLIWRENSKYYLLLGSSNLTQAGLETNIEANSFQEISKQEFIKIIQWKSEIRKWIRVVDEKWISEKYKEAQIKHSKYTPKTTVIAYLKQLPKISHGELQERRNQLKQFSSIKKRLTNLIIKCAKGKVANIKFYETMCSQLWVEEKARIQGRGFEILGKHANWKEACKAIVNIFKADNKTRDIIVRDEIDRLAEKSIPVRGAWLTEMLGQYFPKEFPLLNTPSKNWLAASHYRPTGASEGAEYIDIAEKYRAYLKESKQYINLMELDRAVVNKYPRE